MSEVSALLLDDIPVTRECISATLSNSDRSLRVLAAESLLEVEAALRKGEAPDVVLYSILCSTQDQTQALVTIQRLMGILSGVPLAILIYHEDMEFILEAFRRGVRACVPASLGLSAILDAIRIVVSGGIYLPAPTLRNPTQRLSYGGERPPQKQCLPESLPAMTTRLGALTPREVAVLECLSEGMPNKVIAYRLGMCENTAKAHVRAILKKLGAANRTEAAHLAHAQLLSHPPPPRG